MVLLELDHDPIDKAHVDHILTRWHLVENKNSCCLSDPCRYIFRVHSDHSDALMIVAMSSVCVC